MSDYIPPSSNELRELLQMIKLSRGQAGKLADVTGNRIGKWCSPNGGAIPYSVLFTVLARGCGLQVSPALWRDELTAFLKENNPTA